MRCRDGAPIMGALNTPTIEEQIMTTPSISAQRPAVRASSVKTYLASLCAVLATLVCAMSFVATAPAAAKGHYEITPRTCDLWLAGTDANVYIRLEGTAGTSPWLRLDGPGNDFERGGMNTFSFFLNELGTLKSVVVWRDDWGISPGWCVEHVYVKATVNNVVSKQWFWAPYPYSGPTWIPSGGVGTRLV